MARRFFYVCAGIFLLAPAYHLGSRTATAQVGSTVGGFAIEGINVWVMTPNGDLYDRTYSGPGGPLGPLTFYGNYWASGSTPARSETWGSVKARYR